MRTVRTILLISDVVTIVLAFALSVLLRFRTLTNDIQHLWTTFVFIMVVVLVLFYFYDLYNHLLYAQAGRVFFRIINVWITALLVYVIVGFLTKFYFLVNSRGFIFSFYVLLPVVATFIRVIVIPPLLEHYYKDPRRKTYCWFRGPAESFELFRSFFDSSTIPGLCLCREQKSDNPGRHCSVDFLYSAAKDYGSFFKEIRARLADGRELHVASELFSDINVHQEWCKVASIPVCTFYAKSNDGWRRLVRRAIDIVFSVIILLLLLPLFLFVAIAIKMDSRGPVIYRQQRCGKDGRKFTLYKFRSMYDREHADKKREEEFKEYIEKQVKKGKVLNSADITFVGRILRRTSLDEMPQFFNVLKGDMSLIGPRPPIPYEVKHYRDWHRERLSVKPGISGLWQIYGRGNMPCDSSIFLDLMYIINRSISLDLKLMFKTVPAVLLGKGAY
jgi:exopolysaccharide biosynthesis polyprenyl glycosylphosphotransferase